MKHTFLQFIFLKKKQFLNVILVLGLFLLIYIFSVQSSSAIQEVTTLKSPNSFSCVYQNQEHKFNVFFPKNIDASSNPPLIIMLHGYANNAESFASQTHFEKTACENGYVVAYLTSTPDSKGYIGWNSGLDDSDKDDVGFITELVSYLQKEYHCNPKRTFAVGFSNGAFMTQRLAVDASDAFTAVASVSGMMPQQTWLRRKDNTKIGVLEIYGTKDDVVPMKSNGSDKTTNAPAIEDVMTYWASANNLSIKSEDMLSEKSICTKYTNPDNTNHVWTITIQDGRHSWPEKSFAGFSTNDLIIEFFELYF